MKTHKPKILLGCPTYDGKNYIRESYFQRLKELTYDGKLDFFFVDNSETSDNANWIKRKGFPCAHLKPRETIKQTLADSRNLIREYFLDGDWDIYFSLEADLIPPKDIIEQLLVYKVELGLGVVGAWYEIGNAANRKVCIAGIKDKKDGTGAKTFLLSKQQAELFLDGSLRKAHAIGIGCTMIPRFIMEKFPFRYDPNFIQMDDTWFYVDLHNAGIPVWVDTGLEVTHMNQPWNLRMFYGMPCKFYAGGVCNKIGIPCNSKGDPECCYYLRHNAEESLK